MKKALLRFGLLFVFLFLGIYGLQMVFSFFTTHSMVSILIGWGLIGLDVLYYIFIYKRFYPTK